MQWVKTDPSLTHCTVEIFDLSRHLMGCFDAFWMWSFDHFFSGAVSGNVMILGPQFAFTRWGSIQKVQKVIKEDIQLFFYAFWTFWILPHLLNANWGPRIITLSDTAPLSKWSNGHIKNSSIAGSPVATQ